MWLMTERLAKGQFDRLANGIWGLGQKSMRHMIEIAPLPALVKGEIYHEDLCLEPEFEIRHVLPRALERRPDHVGITISEFEDYVKDPQFTIYSFKRLILNTRTRKRDYGEGVVLMDSKGHSITPRIDELPVGGRRRQGTQAWRDVTTHGGLRSFGPHEADFFLQTIDEVSLAIDSE